MSATVRAAVLSDRDRVLGALSDGIYGGHDYLPLRYDQWFADVHGHFFFVAELPAGLAPADALAGFSSIALLDGGRCGWAPGGRKKECGRERVP